MTIFESLFSPNVKKKVPSPIFPFLLLSSILLYSFCYFSEWLEYRQGSESLISTIGDTLTQTCSFIWFIKVLCKVVFGWSLVIFPPVLFQAWMNGDQMIPQNKDEKKECRHSWCFSQQPMVLLTQGNVLQCHHLSGTQHKTQKISKINSTTGYTFYRVSPGIHAALDTLFVGKWCQKQEACETNWKTRVIKSMRLEHYHIYMIKNLYS